MPAPARRRAPDRHLAVGARVVGADARAHRARLGRRPPRDLRGGAAPRRARPPGPRRRCSSSSSARTSATSIRPAAARVPGGDPPLPASGRRAPARRRSRQARERPAARLRRPDRRDGRLQQEPARPDQHGAARGLRPLRRSTTAPSGTPGERRVEMHLVSRRAQRVRIRRADCEVAFEAGETIWTESSYKYDAGRGRRARSSSTDSAATSSGSSRRRASR